MLRRAWLSTERGFEVTGLDREPDMLALARAAAPGALLLVDLMTRRGMERWNAVTVDEEEDYVLIRRGFYEEASRVGYTRRSRSWPCCRDTFWSWSARVPTW